MARSAATSSGKASYDDSRTVYAHKHTRLPERAFMLSNMYRVRDPISRKITREFGGSIQLSIAGSIPVSAIALATTAPELSVSMMSALQNHPEMALGNAIGSVICNCGLALALCGMLSRTPIAVTPHTLKTSGGFLMTVGIVCFLFVVGDQTLSRGEGGILVLMFGGYLAYLLVAHLRHRLHATIDLDQLESRVNLPLRRQFGAFALGLVGILVASKFIVVSATTIVESIGIPQSVIALTLVALGTSIPEVATSIIAARKNEGELCVGNILGANIMNICWVAGMSSLANNLTLGTREIAFMFPAMFIMVVATLFVLRTSHSLSRREGGMLVSLYTLYLLSFFLVFRV
jgi:cation:H+ antiporter